MRNESLNLHVFKKRSISISINLQNFRILSHAKEGRQCTEKQVHPYSGDILGVDVVFQ